MDTTSRATTEDTSDRARTDDIVRRLVGRVAPEPVDVAGEHQSLAGELHYNSLRMVELASILEDLFELDPSVLAEAPPMGTPAELRDFLLDKVSAGLGTIPGPDDVAMVLDQY